MHFRRRQPTVTVASRRIVVKRIFNHTLVYVLAALVIFVDQYTKHLVRTNLELNESWNPIVWLAPYARILRINNTGAAFGIFQSGGMVFTVIALVVTTVILYYSRHLPDGQAWMRLALGLQLGGAVGNLIDRLVFGPVTDFISVSTFAIFNVADASISAGVTLLALLMWLESRAEKRKQAEAVDLSKSMDAGETSGS
jgi:signal peptidase II